MGERDPAVRTHRLKRPGVGHDDPHPAYATSAPPRTLGVTLTTRTASHVGHEDTPRTWKSPPALAAFLPWGSSVRYHHAGCRAHHRSAPTAHPPPPTSFGAAEHAPGRRIRHTKTGEEVRGAGEPAQAGRRFRRRAGAPVPSPTEDSHSGLVRTIGNRVGDETPRGFKSRILRQLTARRLSLPGRIRWRAALVPKGGDYMSRVGGPKVST